MGPCLKPSHYTIYKMGIYTMKTLFLSAQASLFPAIELLFPFCGFPLLPFHPLMPWTSQFVKLNFFLRRFEFSFYNL